MPNVYVPEEKKSPGFSSSKVSTFLSKAGLKASDNGKREQQIYTPEKRRLSTDSDDTIQRIKEETQRSK